MQIQIVSNECIHFQRKTHVPVWTKSCSQKGGGDRQNGQGETFFWGGGGVNKTMYWVSKRPVAISSSISRYI